MQVEIILFLLVLIYDCHSSFLLSAGSILQIELFNDTKNNYVSFDIQLNTKTHFNSQYFQYGNINNTNSSSLKLLSISSIYSGEDFLGLYNKIDIKWTTSSNDIWITAIRAYTKKDAIVFSQIFESKPYASKFTNPGLYYYPSPPINNSYLFPTLCQSNLSESYGVIQYNLNGTTGFKFVSYPSFPPSISSGGHLIISPKQYPSPYTLVYGSLNEFFVQYIGPNNNYNNNNNNCIGSYIPISYTDSLPIGYKTESILLAVSDESVNKNIQKSRELMPNSGINSAIFEYGDILLSSSNIKQRPNILYSIGPMDVIKDYIGYSTTGFYFYNPCDCFYYNMSTNPHYLTCNGNNTAFINCQTYKQTLQRYYDDSKYKPKWWLLDSWWYGESIYHGTNFWEDNNYDLTNITKSFPNGGLHSFWNYTNNPSICAHSAKWIMNNTYIAQQIGEWIISDKGAMPQDDTLWNYLFSSSHKWGLSLLKHDHLDDIFFSIPQVYENISIVQNWLNGMNNAALKNNIDIDYNVAFPQFLLLSTKYKSVKLSRSSPDYAGFEGIYQWAIAPVIAFDYSLGVLPYKDTFYSNNTIKQYSNQTVLANYIELAPWIHAISATISGGPVSISDKIGSTNLSLLSKIGRIDGKILKPNFVSIPMEQEWFGIMFKEWPNINYISKPNINDDPNMALLPNLYLGELYTTYSKISSYWNWYYIWSVQIRDKLIINNNDLNINYTSNTNNNNQQILMYEWDINNNQNGVDSQNGIFKFVNGSYWEINAKTRNNDNNNGMYGSSTIIVITKTLYLNGWILLGEIGKIVPVSPVRFKSIDVENQSIGIVEIIIDGVQNEKINISFVKWQNKNYIKVIQCTVNHQGTATININGDQFNCIT